MSGIIPPWDYEMRIRKKFKKLAIASSAVSFIIGLLVAKYGL